MSSVSRKINKISNKEFVMFYFHSLKVLQLYAIFVKWVIFANSVAYWNTGPAGEKKNTPSVTHLVMSSEYLPCYIFQFLWT